LGTHQNLQGVGHSPKRQVRPVRRTLLMVVPKSLISYQEFEWAGSGGLVLFPPRPIFRARKTHKRCCTSLSLSLSLSFSLAAAAVCRHPHRVCNRSSGTPTPGMPVLGPRLFERLTAAHGLPSPGMYHVSYNWPVFRWCTGRCQGFRDMAVWRQSAAMAGRRRRASASLLYASTGDRGRLERCHFLILVRRR